LAACPPRDGRWNERGVLETEILKYFLFFFGDLGFEVFGQHALRSIQPQTFAFSAQPNV
jgi:hypothetical protein